MQYTGDIERAIMLKASGIILDITALLDLRINNKMDHCNYSIPSVVWYFYSNYIALRTNSFQIYAEMKTGESKVDLFE